MTSIDVHHVALAVARALEVARVEFAIGGSFASSRTRLDYPADRCRIGAVRGHELAVSMPEELVEAVRAAADEDGETLSGWVADAVARKLRSRAAAEALADFEAKHGVISSEELEAVRREWSA